MFYLNEIPATNFSKPWSDGNLRVSKQRLRDAKTQAVDYLILLIAGACLGSLTKANNATFGYGAYTYTIIAVCKSAYFIFLLVFQRITFQSSYLCLACFSSSVQDCSFEVILTGSTTILERKCCRHKQPSPFCVQRHSRPIQHADKTRSLPLNVLLLQQPKIILWV